MSREIKAKGSALAQVLLQFKGKPIGFEAYQPQKMLYDLYPQFLVIKAGRQVGKSLGLGGRINIGSISQPYFQSLYIAPSQTQTKRFSSGYIDAFRKEGVIAKKFVNAKDPGNVFEKTYTNNSKVWLSYAQTEGDADRIRGLTADLVCIDEIQDVQMSAIPVIKEVTNTSDYGGMIFTGTAKSKANTLEQLWQQSNQMEFVQKCKHCGKWVVPDNYDTMVRMAINENFMVCPHCSKQFSFDGGQWVATKNELSTGVDAKLGLHMPQFIFGANTKPGSRQWKDLYKKIRQSLRGEMYSQEVIMNEIMGLSTDIGDSSISLAEAQACSFVDYPSWCPPDKSGMPETILPLLNNIHMTVLGVDWSVSQSVGSLTVATVMGIDYTGRLVVLYSEKLKDPKIGNQVKRVLDIANDYGCAAIGSDRGVGVMQGELLQQAYGKERVLMCQYVSANRKLVWNEKGNFLAGDRTTNMDLIIHKMRLGPERFVMPNYNFSEPFWEDVFSVSEVESRMGKRLYEKAPSIPDDFLHSVVFANMALNYIQGNFELDSLNNTGE